MKCSHRKCTKVRLTPDRRFIEAQGNLTGKPLNPNFVIQISLAKKTPIADKWVLVAQVAQNVVFKLVQVR